MNSFKLLVIALVLLFVFLGFMIMAPILNQEQGSEPTLAEAPTDPLLEAIEKIEPVKTIEFDLKYDKYLIPEPYTYEKSGETRTFEFEKMIETLAKTEQEAEKGMLTYVDNYKNRNGMAPAYRGKSVDGAGNNRSASAPGYPDLGNKDEFMYISDGTLVRVLEEMPELIKVSLVENQSEYYIPSKYVQTEDIILELNKAVVVDRKNQNIAVFEKRFYGGNMGHEKKTRWTIVSYSLATTGKVGKYHQPTSLGYYFAIEKKERFYYLQDGTDQIEGYAPYAVRFNAGAYTHGVAVAYRYAEDGTRIDPGLQEFSRSIGTVPLSHKCVRNYTSHAKFIYDWYVHGETIVVVIE